MITIQREKNGIRLRLDISTLDVQSNSRLQDFKKNNEEELSLAVSDIAIELEELAKQIASKTNVKS